ncbi:MAG: GNAT family N-acetyltransferase [Sphingomonadales bacterium]
MSVFCFTTGALCRSNVLNIETSFGQKLQNHETYTGNISIYIPEFSKPTGRYVSRLFIRLINASLRKGSLVFAGNPCTPGMSVLNQNQEDETQAIINQPGIRTLVCNYWGKPQTKEGIVFQAEPFMLLKIRPAWKNFEDYKLAMHSKYRVRVNKALSCSQHLTSEWKSGSELNEVNIGIMADMLSATLANKTLALPPNLKGLIKGFCREFGDNYKTVFCYDENGAIVGFLSAIKSGDTVFAMHIGYRPEHARAWHLYQRLMLNLIDKFTGTGIKKIQLGRTATEIKSTLGAEPIENSFVVYTKNILLKNALKFYKRYFFNPKVFIVRQPFREN